ncbi:hypothetical protein RJ640_007857 [Escallonia rubra]|uniref:Phytochrome kinase substrate 1 n=1 Tax=Escallonia rubra TaxID=112253 RepID=A0AA88U8Z7_9ASTE|nr:hypothetical protein RJ640_007857 [Escallonia rubra]
MTMVSSAPVCNSHRSQSLSIENGNNLRDASFSSYLSDAEKPFILKPVESGKIPNSLISSSHEHVYIARKKVEDGEIGVFGAEKYFKGTMDKENPRVADKDNENDQHEKDEPVHMEPVKPKSQLGTPSVQSESSWHSQSALLQRVPRRQQYRRTSKVHAKRLLATLGCNCYCNDKNSVDIDENKSENTFSRGTTSAVTRSKAITKPPMKTAAWVKDEIHFKKFDELGHGLRKEDCFSFPVLKNLAVKVQLQEDGAARKSLDVFGSPISETGKKSLNDGRKLTTLSWDSITPRIKEVEIAANGMYNDSESDASSDLFEIESFSNNSNPFLARDSSDGMSSCVTPRNCYAPSEASIEWSVVTASAADFSAMSDSEEVRTAGSTTNPSGMVKNVRSAPAKEAHKRRPSILMGCKSHRALRVAGDAYRTNEKAIPEPPRHHKMDSFKPVTRFPGETKLTGFDSIHGQRAFDTRSLSRTHSPPSSHLLYIQ